MPRFLSLLLQRTRLSILVLLVLVLPLQSVTQLVAGLQAHRHVHTGAVAHPASALAALAQPVRSLLDRLHAAQDPRLALSSSSLWVSSHGPGDGWHEHGGVLHKHSHDTADVLDVGDPADDSLQAGATAFLAWLPSAFALPASQGSGHPAVVAAGWRDRVVAPPLTPPRG